MRERKFTGHHILIICMFVQIVFAYEVSLHLEYSFLVSRFVIECRLTRKLKTYVVSYIFQSMNSGNSFSMDALYTATNGGSIFS